MTRIKNAKKQYHVSPERLTELRRPSLIASAGSSLRLSGSKVTDEQIEQILTQINKPSEQK